MPFPTFDRKFHVVKISIITFVITGAILYAIYSEQLFISSAQLVLGIGGTFILSFVGIAKGIEWRLRKSGIIH